MALVTRNPGDVIRSQDVDQFTQLLTGVMPDQAVTLPNTTIAGNLTINSITGPTITSAPLTGAAGTVQWWLAIVPVLNGVDGVPGPVFKTPTLGISPLTGTRYYTANFAYAPGATAYKLIGGTGAAQPALSTFQQLGTTLTAVDGQTAYSMLANATGSAYTVQTLAVGGLLIRQLCHVEVGLSAAPTGLVNGSVIVWNQLNGDGKDLYGMLNVTNGRITVPFTGKYLVTIAAASNVGQSTYQIQTAKNGNAVDTGGAAFFGNNGGSTAISNGSKVIHLAANDYLTVLIASTTNSGGVYNDARATFCTVTYQGT